MTTQTTVMKFGGTSVADARAFERVAELVRRECDTHPVVVVSAMNRFTDALLEAFDAAARGRHDEAAHSLEEHFERYLVVARALLRSDEAAEINSAIEVSRRELTETLREASRSQHEASQSVEPEQSRPLPVIQDAVVSHGERLSSQLLAAVLRARGVKARQADARRCIITDDEHGRATPLKEETERHTRQELEPIIAAGEVPVIGGFIASSAATGETTTLGRSGSDFTAGLVGAALHSREIQIWTDVPGVLTADPRIVKDVRTIPRLSYAEAAELAYFGAKVLHPKTILPAVVRNIPVRICNSLDDAAPDTVVYFDAEMTPRTVKAIAHKAGVHIVHVTSARMLGAYGFMRAIFEVFERHRTEVDIVTTSEVSVSISLEDASSLDAIVEDLKRVGAVKVESERAIVCIVGEGLRSTPGIAGRVFSTVKDINVLLISQGASSINLTFVVEARHAAEAVRRLHAAFFECATAELLAHIGGEH
ncbi:MAG TPA: lysine-sensitive aspartokinase 3 [Pyrinomonadaceae bacterium]|nr:lysine-sensitive aspartokinase 3 [Pyrinomonadaceae bacterium]